MGEIEKQPFQRPSAWRRWLTGLIGQKGNPPTVNMILPTYEQAMFEKNIITLRGEVTGDGATNVFVSFSPPADIGSFIVKSIQVLNEVTATRNWRVIHQRQLTDGTAYDFVRARMRITAGATMALIDGSGFQQIDAQNDVTNFQGAPFTCWRNQSAERRGENFTVRTDSNVTLNDVILVTAELEIIPDAAQYRDMSDTLVLVP